MLKVPSFDEISFNIEALECKYVLHQVLCYHLGKKTLRVSICISGGRVHMISCSSATAFCIFLYEKTTLVKIGITRVRSYLLFGD